MNANRHRVSTRLALSLAVAPCALSSAPAEAVAVKKEMQSHFMTAKDPGPGGVARAIWSSLLYRDIRRRVTTDWENLGIFVNACFSGEFATRAASKLPGRWSVLTATDSQTKGTVGKLPANDPKAAGWLVAGASAYDGVLPQYAKKLKADGAAATFKGVADEAMNKSQYTAKEKPQYAQSDAAAGTFKFHGGEKANRALVFGVNGKDQKFSFNPVFDEMYAAVRASGFAATEIAYHRDNEPKAGNIAGSATEGDLETALNNIGDVIEAGNGVNKNKTNVAMMFMGHGGISDRTVVYRDGALNQPGGGAIVNAAAPTVPVSIQDPVVLAGIKEDLPLFSASSPNAVWSDDPDVDRAENPFLSFTTISETFASPGSTVLVRGNGIDLATLQMGNSLGADYQIELTDQVLNDLLPTLGPTGSIGLDFVLPSIGDSFQLAVEEDFELPGFVHRGYGVSIGFAVTASQIPEPAFAGVLAASAPMLLRRRRRTSMA